MLDERFRRRVGELARLSGDALDDAARERIVDRVVIQGPAEIRRVQRLRRASFVAAPLLAAAAAVAFFFGRRHVPVEAPVAIVVSAPASHEPACASRMAPAPGIAFVARGAGSELDLGEVAFAAAGSGSDARLSEASACRTQFTLGSGTVTVHAKDLGGGTLVVRTRDGDVTVRGTIFAVTESRDSLMVEVVEGRVEVGLATGVQFVEAGQRLLVSQLGLARGALTEERARAMRVAVNAPEVVGFDALETPAPSAEERSLPAPRTSETARPPSVVAKTDPRELAEASPAPADAVRDDEPVAPAPEPAAKAESTTVDWLAEAEAARRAGDYAGARERYRRAADGKGATAEAAWVALARMELGLGHSALALEATKRRQERFGQGTLAPEALWIDVRAYRQIGDVGRAQQLAEDLVARWPGSPQARAARNWLAE